MQDEIFKAGVNPGGPGSQTEIKTLLCYILSKMQAPMSFMQLYDALSEDGLVNYFELVRALEQLGQSGHVRRTEHADGSDRYSATALGLSAGEEFTSTIPVTVREKAVAASERVFRRQQRQQEVSIRELPAENGGFIMEFAIPDPGSDLIRFSLFVPTQEECKLMKKRFLNAPMFIYQGVLALLTGNRQILGESFFGDEDLF